MNLAYLKENDRLWFTLLKYFIRLLALILIGLIFFREKELFGLYISKGIFYAVLVLLKALIIIVYTTGLKYSEKGEIQMSDNEIVFADNSTQKKFRIVELGLIDIREAGKNFWTGNKYYHLSIENYDHEIFKLEPLNKNQIAHLSALLQTWAPHKLKVKIFNKKGIKSNLV